MEVRGETVGTLVISEYGGKRGDCGHIIVISEYNPFPKSAFDH